MPVDRRRIVVARWSVHQGLQPDGRPRGARCRDPRDRRCGQWQNDDHLGTLDPQLHRWRAMVARTDAASFSSASRRSVLPWTPMSTASSSRSSGWTHRTIRFAADRPRLVRRDRGLEPPRPSGRLLGVASPEAVAPDLFTIAVRGGSRPTRVTRLAQGGGLPPSRRSPLTAAGSSSAAGSTHGGAVAADGQRERWPGDLGHRSRGHAGSTPPAPVLSRSEGQRRKVVLS